MKYQSPSAASRTRTGARSPTHSAMPPEVRHVGGSAGEENQEERCDDAEDVADGDLRERGAVAAGREVDAPRHERGGHDQMEARGQREAVAQVAVGEPVEREVEGELHP